MLMFSYFHILCVSLVAVSSTVGNQSQDGVQPNGEASYEFGYDIHNPVSNDIKSHHEVRDGKNVLGFYTFKEADGSIRIVKYKVTPETGFEAVVEKIKPDPLPGNSIDGQEAAPSTHGLPQAVTEPRGGANSQYVAGLATRNLPNRRRDVTEAPNYRNGQVPAEVARQRNIQAVQQHPPQATRYRDPYVIRRNPHNHLPAVYDKPQATQYSINNNPRAGEESRYVDAPRGRQRHRFGPPQVQNQPQVQTTAAPTGPIVYIDGIPYIDDIGAFSENGNKQVVINGHVFVPTKQQGKNQQYEVREITESESKEEIDEDKEEYEEDDDDEDERLADFEEEDDEDDEDPDASDFYEENEELINEQQKEYDRLKKAYENDGEEEKAPEPEAEEKKPEPAQE